VKLAISEIPDSGLDFNLSNISGELNDELTDILGENPKYDVTLSVDRQQDMVNISGRFDAHVHSPCSRCAEEVDLKVHKNFVATYLLNETGIKGGALPEEFNEEDASFDVDFLKGPELDLGEVVHEQMGLEIPLQPLCSDQCKGLCFQCGENLNIGSCQCKTIEIKEKPSPFEVLRNIKLK
jgi:uncharacterized protein